MYSGTHFTGRLGAAECSRIMAAGQRHSFTVTVTLPKSITESEPQSQSKPQSIPELHVRTGMEFHACVLQHDNNQLQWRLNGKQEWPELYRAVLEHEPGSDSCRACGTRWIRRPVVYRCSLQRRHSFTFTFAESVTQS